MEQESVVPTADIQDSVEPSARVNTTLLLAGVLAIGATLRWFFSNQRGLTYDDTFSYFLSSQPLGKIVAGTAADTMPPLYYFFLHFWMRLGQEVWWLRSLNILISLATIYLLYCLIRSVASPQAGLWAALIAAISPFQIYHAQDIRMYALLALGQTGYIYCFWKLFYTPERGRKTAAWVGLILFGTIAMYSHNLAIVPLAVADLPLLLQRRWKDLLRLLASQMAIGLLCLPWLVYIPGQIAKIQHAFWTPRPGLVEALQAVVYFHSNWPLASPWIMGITLLLSLQILILGGVEVTRLVRKNPSLWVLVAYVIIPPATLFVLSYLMRPVFVTRVFIVSALIYAGLLGIIITGAKARFVRVFAATAAIACAVGGLPELYGYAEFPRSPFQQADRYLSELTQAGDTVIHDNKLSYFPMKFYAPDLDQQFIADEPGSFNDTLAPSSADVMGIHPVTDIQTAAVQHQRIHFVVFSRTIQEYTDSGLADHPSLAWLKDHYHLTAQRNFNDLQIYTFAH
ncbi:MAG TPA: glycosyltransferase family 39 protein [Anaerolineaceae bacterium]|nr:glycosyltransferase family 39 protein [Anaerolineaceae bacterium]